MKDWIYPVSSLILIAAVFACVYHTLNLDYKVTTMQEQISVLKNEQEKLNYHISNDNDTTIINIYFPKK